MIYKRNEGGQKPPKYLSSPLLGEAKLYLKEYAREFSPHSVEVKRNAITQFIQFLVERNITDWAKCDEKLVRDYIIYRSRRVPEGARERLSASSLQTQLASIRLFFDFLVEERQISYNPAKLISAPKSGKRLPKIVEVDLLQKILDRPPRDELEVRDLAICELLYSSGLRLSELAALNLKSIDAKEREVYIADGKGGKDRIVPVGRAALKALERWLPIRESWFEKLEEIKDENALFISQRGNRLSSRQISNRVKRYAMESGVNINLHPHLLRHSMATHILESSQDIRLVQELLGHADISTTQVYTHLDFGHLSKVFDAAHPRAHSRRRKGKHKPKE